MAPPPLLVALLLLGSMANVCLGSRRLTSLYNPPPTLLTYHHGDLLGGVIPISIVWYGSFTPAHKSTISDFLLSLTPQHPRVETKTSPSVSQWWNTVDELVEKAGKKTTRIVLAKQLSDESCSIGKLVSGSQLAELAARAGQRVGGVVLVLTAADVAVEGFCMSRCGLHGALPGAGPAYVWVGDSAAQCPGQCAWPFHQPVYGPQGPPLVAPSGDVGIDGMVINVAKLLAGTVTNPSGGGYYGGEAGAAVEVAAACTGVFGRGAYPGYAGEVRVEAETGASYNVVGENGRKFLLPAMFDPAVGACFPMT